MLVQGKYLSFRDNLEDVYKIRREVFQVEQGVDSSIELDEYDKEAVHVIVFVGDKFVATGRLYKKDDKFFIGRIAVLKEERGKKYGDFVVRMLVDRAFLSGANEVLLGSQLSAVGFYERIGFEPYGEEYEEAKIIHRKMRLKKGALCKDCHGKNKL